MLTLAEIRQLSEKDLVEEIEKSSRKLLKLKIDIAGGYSKESHSKKNLRKYISQLQTVQNEIKQETL